MIYLATETGMLYTSIIGVFDSLESAKAACEKYYPNRNSMNELHWDGLFLRDHFGGAGCLITPLEINVPLVHPGIKYRVKDRSGFNKLPDLDEDNPDATK